MARDASYEWGNREWESEVRDLLSTGRVTIIESDTLFHENIQKLFPMRSSRIEWLKTNLIYSDHIVYPKLPGKEFLTNTDKVKASLKAFGTIVGSFEVKVEVAGDMATSIVLSLSLDDLMNEAISIFEVAQTVYVADWASKTVMSCTMGDNIDIGRPQSSA